MNTDGRQPVSAGPATLKLMWASVVGGLVMLGLLMFANDYLGFVRIEPLTDIAPYLLWGGLGTLILPMAYLPRYRRDLEAFKQLSRTENTADAVNRNALAQQQGRLLIGYTLADTPAMIGVAYYLLSSDLSGGLLLVIVSIIMLLQYKPR